MVPVSNKVTATAAGVSVLLIDCHLHPISGQMGRDSNAADPGANDDN
jgi:hypothetical protein